MTSTTTTKEHARRSELIDKARVLITKTLPVEDADESSLMLGYGGFYLQISFSEAHPLMVIYLARALNRPGSAKDTRRINDLNLKSVLGGHAVNMEAGCYSYRAAHWLEVEMTKPRFLEMLERHVYEADRAYSQVIRISEVAG